MNGFLPTTEGLQSIICVMDCEAPPFPMGLEGALVFARQSKRTTR